MHLHTSGHEDSANSSLAHAECTHHTFTNKTHTRRAGILSPCFFCITLLKVKNCETILDTSHYNRMLSVASLF